MSNTGLTIPMVDLIIVIVYLVGIMIVGILAGYVKKTSSDQFFLAGHSLKWPMIGAALFTANISTIHLVGLASDGYRIGLAVGNFEWMAAFTLIILGLVFAPFYFKSKISTLPEYLERRYCPAARTVAAFISIFSALFIHIGMSMYAGAKVFEYFFGIPVVESIIIIATVTAIYTILGGLKAVVVTDTIQAVLLLFGAIILTLMGIFALPAHGIESLAQFKAAVKPDQMHMLHSIHNNAGGLNEYSWFSVVFGYPILGIWYWCTDQTIVQKTLGAKTLSDAEKGPLFAGVLKILPVFVMVFPGVLGYVLFKDKIGADNDATLLVMIRELLPSGLKGLFAAGLLAAVMSTIEAALNSTATVTAKDIIKRIWPETKDQTQVLIGRITAAVVIVLAMFWSTQGGKFESIFVAINKIPMVFAPSITCVFLWGVFWKRGTKQAALATFGIGIPLGSIYLLMELIPEKRLITDVWGIPYMQVGFWLFVINSIIYYTVSKFTPAPDPKSLEKLCWDSPIKAITEGEFRGVKDPRVFAAALLLIMIVLYIIFR